MASARAEFMILLSGVEMVDKSSSSAASTETATTLALVAGFCGVGAAGMAATGMAAGVPGAGQGASSLGCWETGSGKGWVASVTGTIAGSGT